MFFCDREMSHLLVEVKQYKIYRLQISMDDPMTMQKFNASRDSDHLNVAIVSKDASKHPSY